MVCQNAQKNMRFHPVLQVMEDGTLAQWAFHAPEGILGPRERAVDPPPLVGCKLQTVATQQIAAIKARRDLPLLFIGLVLELSGFDVEGQ